MSYLANCLPNPLGICQNSHYASDTFFITITVDVTVSLMAFMVKVIVSFFSCCTLSLLTLLLFFLATSIYCHIAITIIVIVIVIRRPLSGVLDSVGRFNLFPLLLEIAGG